MKYHPNFKIYQDLYHTNKLIALSKAIYDSCLAKESSINEKKVRTNVAANS